MAELRACERGAPCSISAPVRSRRRGPHCPGSWALEEALAATGMQVKLLCTPAASTQSPGLCRQRPAREPRKAKESKEAMPAGWAARGASPPDPAGSGFWGGVCEGEAGGRGGRGAAGPPGTVGLRVVPEVKSGEASPFPNKSGCARAASFLPDCSASLRAPSPGDHSRRPNTGVLHGVPATGGVVAARWPRRKRRGAGRRGCRWKRWLRSESSCDTSCCLSGNRCVSRRREEPGHLLCLGTTAGPRASGACGQEGQGRPGRGSPRTRTPGPVGRSVWKEAPWFLRPLPSSSCSFRNGPPAGPGPPCAELPAPSQPRSWRSRCARAVPRPGLPRRGCQQVPPAPSLRWAVQGEDGEDASGGVPLSYEAPPFLCSRPASPPLLLSSPPGPAAPGHPSGAASWCRAGSPRAWAADRTAAEFPPGSWSPCGGHSGWLGLAPRTGSYERELPSGPHLFWLCN